MLMVNGVEEGEEEDKSKEEELPKYLEDFYNVFAEPTGIVTDRLHLFDPYSRGCTSLSESTVSTVAGAERSTS